jgi:hypothetical protein
VAELVDAADSKSAIRKDVKVRFLSWAQFFFTRTSTEGGFFIACLMPSLDGLTFTHFFSISTLVHFVQRMQTQKEISSRVSFATYAIVPIIRSTL